MIAFTHDGPGTSEAEWSAHFDATDAPTLSLRDTWRVVVVAAHPDDESLGAGGLLAHASDLGLEVVVVVATAGESSHPESPTHGPGELAERRVREAERALAVVAPGARLVLAGLADGRVAEDEDRLTEVLVELIGERGPGTLVAAPWRRDGHPDHEAAGRSAAAAVSRTDADLVEYPVWWWHWARPAEAPPKVFVRLPLSASVRSRRAAAIAAHESQVRPLSNATGDEVMLTPAMLDHFRGPDERYVVEPATDGRLDRLHRDEPDPWGVDERWYEERKRRLLLALLPRRRFREALEVGCSTGALTECLAARSDRVTGVDSSPAAVAAARDRLAAALAAGSVRLEEADVPDTWPTGEFDLIVVSEVAYFLSPRRLEVLSRRVEESLAADGVVIFCHWRHPVAGWPMSGARVHEIVGTRSVRPLQATYADRDVEMLVFANDDVWPRHDQ